MNLFFYDTCSLLNLQEDAFKHDFLISDITLYELENIKTSRMKDEETKYQAQNIQRLLKEYRDKYQIVFFREYYTDDIELPDTYDSKIIACALQKKGNVTFVTDDLACARIAEVKGLKVIDSSSLIGEEYKGFKEVVFKTDDDLAEFYKNLDKSIVKVENTYNLLENEYLLIKDRDENILDKYKWKNGRYEKVQFIDFKSSMFGKISPRDAYQEIACDSLAHNKLTILCGKPGSGKTLLAFGYMFQALKEGAIDKIVVFCNTVATRGAAKLGYLPGDRTEKLLDSQIGNLLLSKLGGDRIFVEDMIRQGTLVLLPISDIRGYDTSGMNAAIYITEAQNLSVDMMKLCLQRIGEDCICILDGDYEAQVDLSMYAGSNNGLKRASKVFKGKKFFGQVNLQNIYRSEIAATADLM